MYVFLYWYVCVCVVRKEYVQVRGCERMGGYVGINSCNIYESMCLVCACVVPTRLRTHTHTLACMMPTRSRYIHVCACLCVCMYLRALQLPPCNARVWLRPWVSTLHYLLILCKCGERDGTHRPRRGKRERERAIGTRGSDTVRWCTHIKSNAPQHSGVCEVSGCPHIRTHAPQHSGV